ncbi:MAG: caspase family protein, partial [Geminicoccaceae bacterium]
MFGQCGLGRPIAVTVAAAAIGWLAASSSAGAATKLVRTPEGDTCGQANSAPQQSLPAVIAACDVVVTQAQGRDLGLFHRYRGRALDRSGQSALALPEYDRALEILADDYDTLMWRAALREAVGDKSGAIADYQRLNRLNSRISDWRRAIARLGGTAESPPANEVAGVSPPAGSDEARPPQGKPLQPETRTALQSAQESPPATAGRAQSSAQSTAYQDQLKELGFYEDLDAANATADASGTVEPERQATERFELVRRAQTELTRLGYDIGEIDGVAGSRTRNALRSWLQSTGQPTSREIDPQLVAELEQTRSPEPQQVVEAETKSLESATADNAKPTPLTPEEPVSEPAQLPSQGAMIAATGQQPRDSAAVEPERPEPQSTSPVVLPTDGEKRVALVIGNSGYRNVAALRNPRQDAEDMAKALADIGFTVFPGYDLDRDAMDDLTTKFAREAADADLAVAYYSGHALQYSGENLLVPVDGRLEDQYSLRRLV